MWIETKEGEWLNTATAKEAEWNEQESALTLVWPDGSKRVITGQQAVTIKDALAGEAICLPPDFVGALPE